MHFTFIEIHNPSNKSNKEKDFSKTDMICFISFLYLQLVGADSSVYSCVGIHLVMDLR